MARRSTRKRRPPRQYSPRLIVVCEGEKTEYEYLTRLNQARKRPGGPVVVPLRGCGGDPAGVVERAIRERDNDRRGGKFDRAQGDRAYVLLDVEPHDPGRAPALDNALRLAREQDVCVLLSNPSFEFWLLCHLVSEAEACRAFPNPAALDSELRRRFDGHGKDDLHRDPDLFDRLLSEAEHAVTVARHVHEKHHSKADVRGANACTTVYQLVDMLAPSGGAP